MRSRRNEQRRLAPQVVLAGSPASLRRVLIVPFVLLIAAVATVIGWLSYTAGAQAVDAMADQLLRETARRINDAIERRVSNSHAVLEVAHPSGLTESDDIAPTLEQWRRRLWIAASLHGDSNDSVYYGNRAGQFIGVQRMAARQGLQRLKLTAEQHRSIGEFSGVDGTVSPVGIEERLFDPRERPWYRAAIAADRPVWSDVYIGFRNGALVTTLARRVLSPQMERQGVVATDVPLRALNDFIATLQISPNGVAFIIEPDGLLVASSAGPNVRIEKNGERFRLTAANSGNRLVDAAYAAVQRLRRDARNVDSLRLERFAYADGQVGYVAFGRVRDAADLDWLSVIAVPRADFMAGVTRTVTTTVVLALVAAVLAAAIGSAFYAWVAKDLRLLSAAARRVGEGDLDVPIGIERRDEIGELARAFEAMQARLRTDRLTGLINREAMLRRINALIEQRRGELQRPFALLFVDLNDFKRINDLYGHAAGDQALVQVAERLRGSVREEDLVGRYAGDEFLILLPTVADRHAAEIVRRHVEGTLAHPYLAREGDPAVRAHISGSVGVALFPVDASDAEALIRHADAEMYTRKQAPEARTTTEGK